MILSHFINSLLTVSWRGIFDPVRLVGLEGEEQDI